MIRATSLDAYQEIHVDGSASTQRQKVLREIRRNHHGITDKELSSTLCIAINAITGRRNELLKAGLIKSVGKRPCVITGRNAMVWVVV